MSILPTPFLVRYRSAVPRIDRLPRSGAKLLDLPESARLAWPAELDHSPLPVDLRCAWNARGLGVALTVTGRSIPLMSNPAKPTDPDSFELWVDTRDMQTVHRATRYCHHLCVLPVGGGREGEQGLVVPLPVARASQDAPLADSDQFLVSSRGHSRGHTVEVWIPGETLSGFDPGSQPRLGFYCQLNDAEFGVIPFAVGDGFPAASDPSLWHSLELQDT